MQRSFDKVDQRLDRIDQRLDKIDQRLDKIDQRLNRVDDTLYDLLKEQRNLNARCHCSTAVKEAGVKDVKP